MSIRNKKEKWIIILTSVILGSIALFAIFNWEIIVYLFSQMATGTAIVKEYVLSLGVIGFLAMTLIIIICFFFPFVSSIPIQLASAVSYGLFFGVIHVALAIFLASQLAFLFTKTVNIFSTKKQREEQKHIEECIKNSKRSILWFMVFAYLAPFVPFMVIHIVAASSGMKWWKYSLITLIGPIPDIVVTLWAGVRITSSASPVLSFVILLVILACVVLSMVYKNKIVERVFVPKRGEKDGKGK